MKKIKKETTRDQVIRFINFIVGVTLAALSFNIFLRPNGLVSGLSGISIIVERAFGITPSLFILIVNIGLIILSLITLGFKSTRNSAIGAILYPILIALTTPIVECININGIEPIVLTVCGSVMTGFGLGLVFKAGFTTGGTDIVEQIVHKYAKISVGTSIMIVSGLISVLTFFTLGFSSFIYSMVLVYVVSLLTDKVLLGISNSKTVYVITENETSVKKFIINTLAHGVTVLDGRGGYTGNNQKVIMCIIPTREYFRLKEGIKKIDENALVLVTDAYEVLGGK